MLRCFHCNPWLPLSKEQDWFEPNEPTRGTGWKGAGKMIQPKTWTSLSYHLLIWPLVWRACWFHFAVCCPQHLPPPPLLHSGRARAFSHLLQGASSESSKESPQNKLCPPLSVLSFDSFNNATLNIQNSGKTYPPIPEPCYPPSARTRGLMEEKPKAEQIAIMQVRTCRPFPASTRYTPAKSESCSLPSLGLPFLPHF